MAKRTVIIDDMTGDTGARTRVLKFDGVEYEIDLTDKTFAELRSVLKPYLRAGRAISGKPAVARRHGNGRSKTAHSDSTVIRTWARGQGMAVTERGVVPAGLRAAWESAGSPR